MKTEDPGHIYRLENFGEGDQLLRFLKRSGGDVQYDDEYDGVQTQEVLRALIDRTKFLDDQIPCAESKNALFHLRAALFEYEARAFRRKQQAVNREAGRHNDDARPRFWRENPYDDLPFNEQGIENRPIGKDGHILTTGGE